MNQHVYYQLSIRLLSPLLIGNGKEEHTDNDLLRNGQGIPFIPGSTLAGLLRRCLDNPEEEERLFGSSNDAQGQSLNESLVYVYDAYPDKKVVTDIRDNVALDEYKTAKDGLKFDYEIMNPGTELKGLVELRRPMGREPADCDLDNLLQKALARFAAGEGGIGAKANRGLGRVKVEVRRKAFGFSSAEKIDQWLAFDPFAEGAFEDAAVFPLNQAEASGDAGDIVISMQLSLVGAVSIRVYTTEVEGADFEQLMCNEQAVIPGTSWAGAFRRRFLELTGSGEMERALFGYVDQVDGQTQKAASQIAFSETYLRDGQSKQFTRNAIDRFSAKTKNGALYTERTYYGGSGELTIRLKKQADPASRRAIGAVIADLHHGFLAVGGLTSVGRGRFRIENLSVNNIPIGDLKDGWEEGFINALG